MNDAGAATDVRSTQQLRARSAAFALLARCLGPDVTALTDGPTVHALRTAVRNAKDRPALDELRGLDTIEFPDHVELAGRWVRWFELGRVPPYEGSNVDLGGGGVTPHLADIAGFYAAFHTRVRRERPDHVVAQLEFLALSLMAEAEAYEHGDPDTAEIAAGATRTFVRDHIGRWLAEWSSRVGEVEPLAPWRPLAAAAVAMVRREASLRNVLVVRSERRSVPPADTDAMLECGGGDDWS